MPAPAFSLIFLSRASLPRADKKKQPQRNGPQQAVPGAMALLGNLAMGLWTPRGSQCYSITFKNQWRQFQMTHHNLSGLLGMNFMKTQRLLLDGQFLRMNQQTTDHPPGKQQERKGGWPGVLSRNPGPRNCPFKMTCIQLLDEQRTISGICSRKRTPQGSWSSREFSQLSARPSQCQHTCHAELSCSDY